MTSPDRTAFAFGCDGPPDVVELGAYVVEREPAVLGVYSLDERSAELFSRVARGGFRRMLFEEDERGDVALTSSEVVNLQDLLTRYESIAEPEPDLVAQYEVYRERDCATRQAYAGELVLQRHADAYARLETLAEREMYLGALLTVDPRRLFSDDRVSSARRAELVDALAEEITDLGPYLTRDLDPRAAW
jgi:hypothetical protein